MHVQHFFKFSMISILQHQISVCKLFNGPPWATIGSYGHSKAYSCTFCARHTALCSSETDKRQTKLLMTANTFPDLTNIVYIYIERMIIYGYGEAHVNPWIPYSNREMLNQIKTLW